MSKVNRRTFSLRLENELAEKLATVAGVLAKTQAEVIRDCLASSLDGIIAGEDFQATLRATIEAQNALLAFATASVEAEDELVENGATHSDSNLTASDSGGLNALVD